MMLTDRLQDEDFIVEFQVKKLVNGLEEIKMARSPYLTYLGRGHIFSLEEKSMMSGSSEHYL